MQGEADFLQALMNIRTPFMNGVMEFISLLGDKGIFCVCVGLVLLIFAKTRKTGWEVLLSMLFAFILVNLILKLIVMRQRPFEVYTYLQPVGAVPYDTSFPSGHTANVFACATAIFLNHKKTGIFALVMAALVGFSRLYNCMHYPTDVITGMIIGIVFAILVHYIIYPACEKGVKRLRERKRKERE